MLPSYLLLLASLIPLITAKSVSMDDLLSQRYAAKTMNASWSSPSSLTWQDALSGDLISFDVATQERKVLVEGSRIRSKVGSKARLMGKSDSTLLFATEMSKIWDFSFEAVYLLLDLAEDNLLYLADGHRLRYAAFIANSNSLVFVKQNDVFYLPDHKEVEKVIRITDDGIKDQVFNGIPDWVHEVEVMYRNNALYPSPNADFLAMVKFDDRSVNEYTYPVYGQVDDLVQYPGQKRVRYPKVGTTNPTVKVLVQNLDDLRNTEQPELKTLEPPQEALAMGELGFNYIKWMNNDAFFVLWKNRPQNKSVLALCERKDGDWPCRSVHQQSEPEGWLPWAFSFGPPISHSSGKWALLIEKKHVAEDDSHYYHIVKFDLQQKNEAKFLTSGRFVVSKIVGWDESGQRVFFTASLPDQPGVRHLFSVSDSASETEPYCISCSLSMPNNESPCQYSDAVFSPDFELFLHQCLGPNVPQTLIRRTNEPEKIVHLLENNDELRERLVDLDWPKVIRMQHRVESRKHPGRVYNVPILLKLPSESKRESLFDGNNSKIPLVVEVFAGPNSQKITSKWGIEWGEILTSTYGVAHAFIDGRCTGFQSTEYMFECYRHVGSVEVEDQISATELMLDEFEFLDSSRVSIFGSSYGGFMTLMTLAQDEKNVFDSGIAISAITDNMLYNTMSSERYMNLPEDNWLGYENSSVLKRARHLEGKTLMINHGVADENSHVQQVMLLFRELINNDIGFEQKLYPDQGHNIVGDQKHLYKNMERFWRRVLNI